MCLFSLHKCLFSQELSSHYLITGYPPSLSSYSPRTLTCPLWSFWVYPPDLFISCVHTPLYSLVDLEVIFPFVFAGLIFTTQQGPFYCSWEGRLMYKNLLHISWIALQILAFSGYVVICLLKQLDFTEHVHHFWLIFWGFNHSMVCFLPCEILVTAFRSWCVEFSLPLVWWCWGRSTSRTAGSFLSPSHPGSPSTLGPGFAAHGFAIARLPKLQGNGAVSLWVRTSLYLVCSHLTLQQRGV